MYKRISFPLLLREERCRLIIVLTSVSRINFCDCSTKRPKRRLCSGSLHRNVLLNFVSCSLVIFIQILTDGGMKMTQKKKILE